MLQQARDFREESETFFALLDTLSDQLDGDRPVFRWPARRSAGAGQPIPASLNSTGL